ncbi:TPA: hypothetical protein MC494_003687 [Escherichia coli]|nr:hypothetical protein [Salmonella enterica subsp. enterica serovar Elisabethville]HBU6400171.1 hypothetical protein [Escherichia coli]
MRDETAWAAGAFGGLMLVLAGLCELASVVALLAAALNTLEIHSVFDRLYPAFTALQWLWIGVGLAFLPGGVWLAAKALGGIVGAFAASRERKDREQFHGELVKHFMAKATKRKTNGNK